MRSALAHLEGKLTPHPRDVFVNARPRVYPSTSVDRAWRIPPENVTVMSMRHDILPQHSLWGVVDHLARAGHPLPITELAKFASDGDGDDADRRAYNRIYRAVRRAEGDGLLEMLDDDEGNKLVSFTTRAVAKWASEYRGQRPSSSKGFRISLPKSSGDSK